jgi:hypothetical protein
VYKARDIARAAVRAEIQAIDVIARRVLGLPAEAAPSGEVVGEDGEERAG